MYLSLGPLLSLRSERNKVFANLIVGSERVNALSGQQLEQLGLNILGTLGLGQDSRGPARNCGDCSGCATALWLPLHTIPAMG